MRVVHRRLVFSLLLISLIGWAHGTEEEYPMPEVFSQSLIMGKTLRNPFAAKLRISQSRMKDLVAGDPGKLEAGLLEKFSLGTTMYFGEGSKHNRALINGRVRRPGDVLMMPDDTKGRVTLDAIRPHEVTLGHRDHQTGRAISLTLKTAEPNPPSTEE